MAGLSLSIVEIARGEGVDLTDVVLAHGLTLEALGASDAYVPVALHERLWEQGATRTGRSDFGMFAAERFTPGLTGVVEYLLRNCATVRDAAETWIRLASAVSDCIEGRLAEHEGAMKLTWTLHRPMSLGANHWAEFAQARTLRLMRDGLGAPGLSPTEVWFRHPAMGSAARHEAFFHAPVRFGRGETALVWSKELLEAPLKWVDTGVRRALEDRAEQLVQSLHDERPFAAKVASALETSIREPGADTRLQRIADRLRTKPRTLQATLERAGLSFRALAEQAKSKEASRLLAEETLTMSEIAKRLGYGDASALRKALRRWRKTP
ncbi:MAG: AraC family transcriptional regulator [Polyangiaceae bacterium]